MAECVMRAARAGDSGAFQRLPPMKAEGICDCILFSGGVSEFIDGDAQDTGDLGAELAEELVALVDDATVVPARQGIRATVVGASQYTVQVSGSTIYLDPDDILPLRNVAAIAPDLDLAERVDASAVAAGVAEALARADLGGGRVPVAVAVPWRGSASYARLAGLARGVVAGMRPVLDRGHPLVLVTDGDVGGLLGMQCRSEERVPGAIVSIDGISLSEFDFIDVGEVLRCTGALPVVVKSLLFQTV
jgi:ethanolamine utilization protein EutA